MFRSKPNAANKPLLAAAVVTALAAGAFANVAHAADDSSLTWHGITLYGTVDVGAAYQTHGAPLSQYWGQGLQYLIAKNSNDSRTTFAPNGLSQTKIGLKGTEEIGDGFSGVFNAEVGFQPNSFRLSDGPRSLIKNNGVPQANQTSGSDSSRAGQFFNGPAYFGLDSKQFGTLTFGRHNSLMLDNFNVYDPMGSSYAFSLIGFSSSFCGMGDTEDARLDDSIKYAYKTGMFHIAGLYQFGHLEGNPAQAWQGDIGFTDGGFSIDGIYGHKKDAINGGSLSSSQVLVEPVNSLTATISNNTAYVLDASYAFDQAKVFGGYEHIRLENPSAPIAGPFDGLGGYLFSVISNTTYTHPKVLQVYWVGARYAFTPKFDLTGAWYHEDQNSFKGNGCSDNSASSCSGTENVYSVMGDYKFTKRFDGYAGVAFSKVSNGLASGFLHTSTADPMVGFRFRF
jgi:predicted porin